MKKAVLALAVLMLLPLLGQAQSVTGYIDPAFQKTMYEAGVTTRVSWEVDDAIVSVGGGGASGTGGAGWYSQDHHWNTTVLSQLAKKYSDRKGYIAKLVKEENLDNTYEALVSIGQDPLLTAIELGDKQRKEAILRSLNGNTAVVAWKTYKAVSSSGYGSYSYSYSTQYQNKKVQLSDEGAKKAQQILSGRKLVQELRKKNGESATRK